MIEEKELDSWQALEAEITNLNEVMGEKSEKLLFRGQPNSTWKLDTTMERQLKGQISLIDYYKFAHSAKSRVETLVKTSWDIPTPWEYDQWLKKKDPLRFFDLPAYDYLAYLRHHGFPSPFLDWTASPYIVKRCCEKMGSGLAITHQIISWRIVTPKFLFMKNRAEHQRRP
ncbi:MAG: FRG domain-containing protein [Gammaproteobacteria bacterium]